MTRPPENGHGTTAAGPRVILAVDDDAMVRRIAAENLRRLGFAVVEAADGEAAMRILGDSGSRIDLLFADIRMPGPVSGPALAEMAMRQRPTLKVLLTSGSPRDVEGGPVRFPVLNKPYRRADLAAAIDAVLAAAPTSPG